MVSVVVINNTCTIHENEIHTLNQFNLNKLYQHKTNTSISLLHVFDVLENICVGVFGTQQGNAGNENKYELPPPIDNILLFGNIIIVGFDSSAENLDVENIFKNSLVSIGKKEWCKYYENLFGGFDTLSNSENDATSQSDIYDSLEKTKSGYALDGFVVNDEEITYVNDTEDDNGSDCERIENDSDYDSSENDSEYDSSENDSDCDDCESEFEE